MKKTIVTMFAFLVLFGFTITGAIVPDVDVGIC